LRVVAARGLLLTSRRWCRLARLAKLPCYDWGLYFRSSVERSVRREVGRQRSVPLPGLPILDDQDELLADPLVVLAELALSSGGLRLQILGSSPGDDLG